MITETALLEKLPRGLFIGGEWHLLDATGMAQEGAMAKIGVGRDASDVAFLTSFGVAVMNSQLVEVSAA